jgi:putative ABC transport system permease protein
MPAMVSPSPLLAVVVVLLTLLAAVAVAGGRVQPPGDVLTAAIRAAVQLAAVSAVLVLVLRSLVWTAVFVTFMYAVAAATAARRVGLPVRRPWTAPPIAAGAVPVVVLVIASGTVPWQPQSVLPVAGVMLGGTMTATSVAARRMFDELAGRAGEYEAALALGLPAREAALEIAQPAAGLALVPALDQTRTVALVTLPGTYIGVLLGGGSAAEAGAAQLLVLVGLLAAEAVAVRATIELVTRRRLLTPALLERLPT